MFSYRVSLKYEISNAELLYEIRSAKMDLKTTKNGYKIKSHPIKDQIDNEEFFNSIGMKTLKRQLYDGVQRGKNAVTEFMKRKAAEKNALLSPDKTTIADVHRQRLISSPMSVLRFIPEEKPKISWTEGYMDIKYEKDDIDISWDTGGVSYEYIPYSIEIYVEKWVKK